ncbi:MAG TPA: double-strand break repair protein AddB [Rhodospirillaceae bacterium]|nr:double-strand break repair protein AddB [Rhodospirillaceae bacterium]
MWSETKPDHPIIAAGSTGSVPAVARLMKAIAGLPRGEVILPALDLSLDEDGWQAVSETHAQFTMKSWLETAAVKREAVGAWENVSVQNAPRVRLLQETMCPAEVSDRWQKLTAQDIPPDAIRGLEALALDHGREEAEVIALRLRGALEEAGKTAALVTPDRALAARVAAALTRWGIAVNDSAGAPLDALPVGRFLVEAIKAAAKSADPIDYLTLLKHPLTAAGIGSAQAQHCTRSAEEKVWRGVRRTDGLHSAAIAMEEGEARAWLLQLAKTFKPITEAWYDKKPLAQWIDDTVALVEGLATTDSEAGVARLWRGEDGEAAAAWLNEWRGAAEGFLPLDGADYLALFEELMHQVAVRPAYGQHPRLSILGPLEARLLHHDLIILGGLNEGTWPPDAPVDPWLSRPMKKQWGLPLPERRIGLSAHDFACLASAPCVMMTRSRRSGGSPAVPSRFWVQLETVLQAAGMGLDSLVPSQPWRDWARAMDTPDGAPAPCLPPAPCPPLAARPTRLSVTEIGTWLSNPYAIYAKHVLKLKKLEPIDAPPSMADFGTIVHAALEAYVKEADLGVEVLLAHGRAAFAPFADRPQVMAFWWPRFERMAAWFVAHEEERRAKGITPLAVEAKGLLSFGSLSLSGRVDRMDLGADGAVEIIDYKTGAVPKLTQVMAGYEPQLALLALMAQAGAFEGIEPQEVAKLSYWALMEKKEEKREMNFANDIDAQCEKAREGLEALIAVFADPATPYTAVPKPQVQPRFNDYAHLSRLAEWGGAQEGGEE